MSTLMDKAKEINIEKSPEEEEEYSVEKETQLLAKINEEDPMNLVAITVTSLAVIFVLLLLYLWPYL